jgi:hypothetical protein
MRTKLWITVALFLFGLVATDRGLGFVVAQAYEGVRTGSEGRINDALANADVDLMIFGSSRAANHLAPVVFLEHLGLRSYNAGSGGQGIVYARLLQSLLFTRGTRAKLLLLQVEPRDLYRDDVERAMAFLPHVDESPLILQVLAESNPAIRFKLWSRLYRYNSWGLSPLRRCFIPGRPYGDGFAPLPKPPTILGLDQVPLPEEVGPIRGDKEQLLRGFAAAGLQHGVDVAFVTVPRFDGSAPLASDEERALERIRVIAAAAGAWMIELHREPSLQDASLYRDRLHLTGEGAWILSRLVAEDLKRRLSGRS